jgi:hypothetical protein
MAKSIWLLMLQTCQSLERWKKIFLSLPKITTKFLSAKSFLFLVVQSSTMVKFWRAKTKKLSTLQTLTLKFKTLRIFFFSSPKFRFELRTTKSFKILVFQTSTPNFGAMRGFSTLYIQIFLSLMSKFGNLGGFFLFMLQNWCRFQNSMAKIWISKHFLFSILQSSVPNIGRMRESIIFLLFF